MPAYSPSTFPDDQRRLARGLKALAHPARLAIVRLLAERDECICGDIVDDLPLAQSTVSQHLKALREAGLVQATVEGRTTCYCLDPEAVAGLKANLTGFMEAVEPTRSDACCDD